MVVLLLLLAIPLAVSALKYSLGDRAADWRSADRSSASLLPEPAAHPEALVRVFAARTVRWRGIFAVHTWIVVKARNEQRYTRYDYTAWGDPIRVNGFVADGRWFGGVPEVVAAADGDAAEAMIPRIRTAVESYKLNAYGDYRAWPGPNSNTFVAAVMASAPELRIALPPTAIGKDYPVDGNIFGLTSSGTGVRASLGGYLGLTVGWVEGIEFNLFGAVLGVDIRRPAVKLPGIGRLGLAEQAARR